MGLRSLDKITALQRNPANTRNLCILAHVDHGESAAFFFVVVAKDECINMTEK